MTLEPDYLDQMDRIVGLLEAEARERVAALRRFGWFLAGSAWVGLAGIGWLVIRPSSRLIQHQFALVHDAQEDAEAEVRHRTEVIERANSNLRSEAEHRLESQAEHRALVEQFSHVSRINTVGEMATSLAHEINQPLGAVANHLDGCLVALDEPSPPLTKVQEALTKALAATHRAGQILHRIRQFVRRHPVLEEQFDANPVVNEVEAMLRDEEKRQGIRLKLDLVSSLPCLKGDPVQIQRVLVNLVRSGIDALKATRPPSPNLVLLPEGSEPKTVRFAVSDNGEGIPPDKLLTIFDPFSALELRGWDWRSAGPSSKPTKVDCPSSSSQDFARRSSLPSPPPVNLMTTLATVFVVDDDPDIRDSLTWLMATVSLAVKTYGSADE